MEQTPAPAPGEAFSPPPMHTMVEVVGMGGKAATAPPVERWEALRMA